MLEHGWTRGRNGGRTLRFGHQRVALVAFLADDSAVGTHMLSVMAAEAAIEVVMPRLLGWVCQFTFISGN